MTAGPLPAVREADEDDIVVLAELLGAFQEDARRHDDDLAPGESLATAEVAGNMLAICRERRGMVLVAELDGRPAGFATCTLGDDDISLLPGRRRNLEIDDLFVVPGARRRGVARALIEAIAEHGRALGARHLTVTAYAGNAEAGSTYRDAGFGDHQVILRRRL